jgi:hypothetical protein
MGSQPAAAGIAADAIHVVCCSQCTAGHSGEFSSGVVGQMGLNVRVPPIPATQAMLDAVGRHCSPHLKTDLTLDRFARTPANFVLHAPFKRQSRLPAPIYPPLHAFRPVLARCGNQGCRASVSCRSGRWHAAARRRLGVHSQQQQC